MRLNCHFGKVTYFKLHFEIVFFYSVMSSAELRKLGQGFAQDRNGH